MAGHGQEIVLRDVAQEFPRVFGGEFPLAPEEAALWLAGEVQDAAVIISLCQRYSADPSAALWLRYGRSALGAALDVCGVRAADRVAMPSYQCVAVVKKIASRTSCGIPYRLDARLLPDRRELLALAGSARAVITCVYFGSQAIERHLHALQEELMRLPQQPWVIEDRVMCLPDPRGLRGSGQRCDVTIFSFRKHYPVPDGALLLAHSDRARERLEAVRRAASLHAAGVNEALFQKVRAKVKRYAWRASGRLLDDPEVNGLPESVASEGLIDQAAASAAADLLPGSTASAVFLHRTDLSHDSDEVAIRARALVERLAIAAHDAVQMPFRDCRGIGVPLLVEPRSTWRDQAARRGIFLPVHWPAHEAAVPCPVARRWHEQELTLPTPAWATRDETRDMGEMLARLWSVGTAGRRDGRSTPQTETPRVSRHAD